MYYFCKAELKQMNNGGICENNSELLNSTYFRYKASLG